MHEKEKENRVRKAEKGELTLQFLTEKRLEELPQSLEVKKKK